MPTTTSTIYAFMANKLTQQSALEQLTPNPESVAQLQADLSAGSRVSVWRLLMWVVAYCAKVQQDLFDRFRVDTLALAKDGHFGTRRWFVAKAKQFQLGDVLIFTPLDAGYATENPAARIVTHAAVVEMANVVVIKVAKAQGTGLVKLAPAELVAISDYFQELRPPVQVTVLTADADRIRLTGSVVYDGQQPLAGVQAAVNYAIGQYLKELAFGGVVRNTDIKEVMLAAEGVVDVRLDLVEVRTTGPWSNIPRVHYTYAGHAVIDPTAPITSTLAWQVGNV